ncbi:WD40 repeat-like protein [Sistotremastrum niveocremeum HHB9708]|uniref:WD40 repeat-like protein n=1 Tax=Sistotremastrum niveocremeum HHB9708 TaxID=1314777 RepID=A0A164RJ99_9AGAM|nr:WD40 repeat-like protein [Sistotremastrum niveocremeum HHB9708]
MDVNYSKIWTFPLRDRVQGCFRLSFDSDGLFLGVTVDDGRIIIFEMPHLNVFQVLSHEDWNLIYCFQWLSNGNGDRRTFALGTESGLLSLYHQKDNVRNEFEHRWDVNMDGSVDAMAYDAVSGQLAAATAVGDVVVYTVSLDEDVVIPKWKTRVPGFTGGSHDPIRSLAFDGEQAMLRVVCMFTGTVHSLSLATGEVETDKETTVDRTYMCSLDRVGGTMLFSHCAPRSGFSHYSFPELKLLRTYDIPRGRYDPPNYVIFAEKGDIILATCQGGHIHIFDAKSGQTNQILAHSHWPADCLAAFSYPDRHVIVSAGKTITAFVRFHNAGAGCPEITSHVASEPNRIGISATTEAVATVELPSSNSGSSAAAQIVSAILALRRVRLMSITLEVSNYMTIVILLLISDSSALLLRLIDNYCKAEDKEHKDVADFMGHHDALNNDVTQLWAEFLRQRVPQLDVVPSSQPAILEAITRLGTLGAIDDENPFVATDSTKHLSHIPAYSYIAKDCLDLSILSRCLISNYSKHSPETEEHLQRTFQRMAAALEDMVNIWLNFAMMYMPKPEGGLNPPLTTIFLRQFFECTLKIDYNPPQDAPVPQSYDADQMITDNPYHLLHPLLTPPPILVRAYRTRSEGPPSP